MGNYPQALGQQVFGGLLLDQAGGEYPQTARINQHAQLSFEGHNSADAYIGE